jgi:hypothetical protein
LPVLTTNLLDDVGSLDSLLDIGDIVDWEVGFEECLESIFLDLSLDLHRSLVGLAIGIFYGFLSHLELLLEFGCSFFVFELHLIILE